MADLSEQTADFDEGCAAEFVEDQPLHELDEKLDENVIEREEDRDQTVTNTDQTSAEADENEEETAAFQNEEVDDEDCRSSATPTQDDLPADGGSPTLHAGQLRLTAGLVTSLTASLDDISSHPVIADVVASNADEADVDPVSDGDLDDNEEAEDMKGHNSSGKVHSDEDDERQRRLSSLSPVSNSSLPAVDKSRRVGGRNVDDDDGDDISSLSDFSSPRSIPVENRSDLEDGEIIQRNTMAGMMASNTNETDFTSGRKPRLDSERSVTSRASRSNGLEGRRSVSSRFSRDGRVSSRAGVGVDDSDAGDGGTAGGKKRKKKKRRRSSSPGSRRGKSLRDKAAGSDDEDLLDNSPRNNVASGRGRGGGKRRRELERYDVRNVILQKRRKKHSAASRSPSKSRSRSRSRSRSWSRSKDRRSRSRNLSRNRSRSGSRSRRRRQGSPRDRWASKRPRRSPSGDRRSPVASGRRGRSSSRSRSRFRSRSRSFSPGRRRASPGSPVTRRNNNNLGKKNKKSKKRRGRASPTSRRRSLSRSPSVILEDRFSRSRSPYSPVGTKKGRKGRSSVSPRRRKDVTVNKNSKKSTKLGKKTKSGFESTLGGASKKTKVRNKSKRGVDDDDVVVEKTVLSKTSKKKKNRRLNVVGGTAGGYDDDLDDLSQINTHVSSEIADKEVFTSGDKIMISVNFRSNNRGLTTSNSPKRKRKKGAAASKAALSYATGASNAVAAKPMCVIDVMSSPYRIIEESPKEVVDVFSDDEDGGKKKSTTAASNNSQQTKNSLQQQKAQSKQQLQQQRTTPPTLSDGPQQQQQQQQPHKTPSPKETPEKQQQQQQTIEHYDGNDIIIHTGHKGPCTPPPAQDTMIDLTRGPQTPPDDSYDPCNPTESPDMSWDNQGGHSDNDGDSPDHRDSASNGASASSANAAANSNSATSNGGNIVKEDQMFNSLMSTAAKAIPFLFEDGVGGATTNGGVASAGGDRHNNNHNNDSDKMSIDMDMDSPSSPQSSDISDLFEPPLDTPLTNKKLGKNMKRMQKSDSRANQKKGAKASAGKLVHMKVVDDKLRIIDDVPSSAVEMAVKEKFLKKVQRQERAVEEIKMVLKPHYNRKKIDKEQYKEILRKCVPKVCHSKNGDINPVKIQKLVSGYVKKYSYARKRTTQRSY